MSADKAWKLHVPPCTLLCIHRAKDGVEAATERVLQGIVGRMLCTSLAYSQGVRACGIIHHVEHMLQMHSSMAQVMHSSAATTALVPPSH